MPPHKSLPEKLLPAVAAARSAWQASGVKLCLLSDLQSQARPAAACLGVAGETQTPVWDQPQAQRPLSSVLKASLSRGGDSGSPHDPPRVHLKQFWHLLPENISGHEWMACGAGECGSPHLQERSPTRDTRLVDRHLASPTGGQLRVCSTERHKVLCRPEPRCPMWSPLTNSPFVAFPPL